MKRTLVFLLSCLAAGLGTASAETAPARARSVYLMQMGHGFDQFLANHLARTGVFEVVTDAKLADTVLTDRIGRSFETQMQQLFGEPKRPPASAPKDKDEDSGVETIVQAAPVGALSSFGRGKGNFFLVDARNARVLWSTYEQRATGSDPVELDRAAERIVSRLKKDILKAPKKDQPAAQPAEESPEEAPPAPAQK